MDDRGKDVRYQGQKKEEESDTFQRAWRKKRESGRDRERLLCFFLEAEEILSRGVMSTTASICMSHLYGNMMHHSAAREMGADSQTGQ